MSVILRPYQIGIDHEAVFNLWKATLGTAWPLDAATFDWLLGDAAPYQAGNRLVAVNETELVGFVALSVEPPDFEANLTLLMIAPSYQRQRIGTQLHRAALDRLNELGVTRVQLGGGSPRVWPGLPVELTGARQFFQSQGWQLSHLTYDLTLDLKDYQARPEIINRLEVGAVTFELAKVEDQQAIVEFERQEFPGWLDAYEAVLAMGDYEDVLLVRDGASRLAGALIMYSAHSNPRRTDVNWKASFGPNAGAIGCVGIAQAVQKQGLGCAMVAHASQLLSERGVGICLIGWTTRANFYQQIGYQIWHSYQMGWRDLA